MTAEQWLVSASTDPSITPATTTQGAETDEVQDIGFYDAMFMDITGVYSDSHFSAPTTIRIPRASKP